MSIKHEQPLWRTFGYLQKAKKSNEDILKLNKDQVLNLLHQYGAILFRGYSADLEAFRKFSDQFSSRFLVWGNEKFRPTLSEDKTVAGVTVGEDELPLHGELYHSNSKYRPDYLWLYCKVPSSIGGATTLCDGVQFLENLDPAIRRKFESTKIRYRHFSPPDGWREKYRTDKIDEALQIMSSLDGVSIIKVHDAQIIEMTYTTSAIFENIRLGKKVFINNIEIINQNTEKTRSITEFADGEPITDEMLHKIHEVGEQLTVEIDWHPNDIVMVDNQWILHGRRKFRGERQMATRFGVAA